MRYGVVWCGVVAVRLWYGAGRCGCGAVVGAVQCSVVRCGAVRYGCGAYMRCLRQTCPQAHSLAACYSAA